MNGAGPVQGNISNYSGSWPKAVIHFLKKSGYMNGAILEPFAGKSNLETMKLDINPTLNPDIVGAAHKLPFKDNCFDSAILDPPYTEKFSKTLYITKMPNIKNCMKETVRCLRHGAFMSVLCLKNMPTYKYMTTVEKVFVSLGPDRHVRCLNIYKIDKTKQDVLCR